MAVMTHDSLCFDYMGTTTRYCSCWRIAERIQREREAAAEVMRAACVAAVEALWSEDPMWAGTNWNNALDEAIAALRMLAATDA